MNKRLNQDIRQLITDFENLFGPYLDIRPEFPKREDKLPPAFSKHFTIFVAEKRFSDWDLHCQANPNRIDRDIIWSMNDYIRTHPLLIKPGLIVATYKVSSYHDYDTKNVLQVMAYIKNQNESSFLDFNIDNVPNDYIKSLVSKDTEKEFVAWMILTYWRKLANGEPKENWDNFLRAFILPHFDDNEKEAILNNPVLYFESYLRSNEYSAVVDFLKK